MFYGTSWKAVPGAFPANEGLEKISGSGTNNIWVVSSSIWTGTMRTAAGKVFRFDPVGMRATLVRDFSNQEALSVFSLSPTSTWVVGSFGISYFDGTSWKDTPSVVTNTVDYLSFSSFVDLWASSPTDVWAISNKINISPPAAMRVGIAHYDGNTWTLPYWQSGPSTLFGIGGADSSSVWVAGTGGVFRKP